jgi:hypothetical protein
MVSYDVVDKKGKPYVQVEIAGDKKVFSPEEISAMILGKMKETAGMIAENHLLWCDALLCCDVVCALLVSWSSNPCCANLAVALSRLYSFSSLPRLYLFPI